MKEQWRSALPFLEQRAPGETMLLDNSFSLPALGYAYRPARESSGDLLVKEWEDRPLPPWLVLRRDPGGYDDSPPGPPTRAPHLEAGARRPSMGGAGRDDRRAPGRREPGPRDELGATPLQRARAALVAGRAGVPGRVRRDRGALLGLGHRGRAAPAIDAAPALDAHLARVRQADPAVDPNACAAPRPPAARPAPSRRQRGSTTMNSTSPAASSNHASSPSKISTMSGRSP